MSRTQPKLLRRHRKTLAGAVAALAAGGLLAGCGSSTSSTPTANATNAAATAPSGSTSGQQGVLPAAGKTVTGAAADKAKAAATAKYPGTVERVEQLSDGSYLVHVMRTPGGEVHVKVSKDFTVTGTQSGPPAGAKGGAGFGTPVTGTAAAKAKAAATAKYPGTVERVMQLPDGSYEVHVVTKSGEVHVKVSKAFAVTGTETGPPAGAAPPASNGTTTTQSS
jgi:hypothetical protein